MQRPQKSASASNAWTGAQTAQRRWQVIALLYGLFFLITLAAAYSGNLPSWFQAIPYYDKVGHVGLYAIATYLGHRLLNYRKIRLGSALLPLFPLGFALFTTAEELGQGLSPNRTLDALDLVCSLVGVVLGYGLAWRSQRQHDHSV